MRERFEYNLRNGKAVFFIILLLLIASTRVRADDYTFLSVNGHIKTGNSIISLLLLTDRGDLLIESVTNHLNNKTCRFANDSKIFSIHPPGGTFIKTTLNHRIVPETKTCYEYQLVEILSEYDKYTLNRSIKIYKKSPLITFDFYIRINDHADFKIIPDSTFLFDFFTGSDHWKLRAVEFFDRTDLNNTLVTETDKLSFMRPVRLRGNILIACNPVSDFNLIFIREAPCSDVQLHYPGYDYTNTADRLMSVNPGMNEKDLTAGKWIRTYGFAFGITGTDELEYLTAIRVYQKHYRKIIPERDEMIMMNTWGDRSAGSDISESFVRNEIDICRKLGVTHFQIDDGWQKWSSYDSLKKNKLYSGGFAQDDWMPSPEKFPSGLLPLSRYAGQNNIRLGLWFVPDGKNNYNNWKNDAGILIDLFKNTGISFFKIDAVNLVNKVSEINFRNLLDSVISATDGQVHFNLDVTAGIRGGYFFLYEYGSLFLENRYTDWGNYYPYQTLRNLWMLSKYVAPERLQIEFLNNMRNREKYRYDDPFAPSKVPFDYVFAITMAAQPLAWFEGANLYPEAFVVGPVIRKYREIMHDFHSGIILPIGNEPDGRSFTGFQSVRGTEGYIIVYRENNHDNSCKVKTWFPANTKIRLDLVIGTGQSFTSMSDANRLVDFSISDPDSYALYRYEVID